MGPLNESQRTLANRWSRLPAFIIRKYYPKTTRWSDQLLSVAMEGLIVAAFTYPKGCRWKFSTWAGRKIHWSILGFLRLQFLYESRFLNDPNFPMEDIPDHRFQFPDDSGITVAKCLAAIDERRARILGRRFGLNGGDLRTLEDIAIEEGLTKQRILVLQNTAISEILKQYPNLEDL